MNSLDIPIHSTLKAVFGFDRFREGQEAVISKILEGKSALAVFPTGGGKSLCYQLSALHLDGLSLVISPLIALMKDQIDFLQKRHIPAARIDGSIVVELAEHSGCIVRHLLHYFGEELGRDCGHCSSCSGRSSRIIRMTGEMKTARLEPAMVSVLRKRYPSALVSPRQIARFFCGLNSPMLTQTKLNKHADFGSLADVPFHLVMQAAEFEQKETARPSRNQRS
jgi:superfamily II DNA helicase RecQ